MRGAVRAGALPRNDPGAAYCVLSTSGAPGGVFMTAPRPLSLTAAVEYSSLVPMISPFAAVSTKYGLPLVAVFGGSGAGLAQ